jgi:hypothetical protein
MNFKSLLLFAWTIWSSIAFAGDTAPGFETQDLEGTTTHFNGSLTTSSVAVPSSATTTISELLFKCPYQTPTTRNCQISFDGGATFFTIDVGEFIAWSPKGKIKQVYVKSGTAGTTYIMVINRETY